MYKTATIYTLHKITTINAKPCIATLLLMLFCFSQIRPVLPFLEYYLNYEYISEVLCINKEEPVLNCNGKCYLSQQLKAAKEAEKNKRIPIVIEESIPMLVYEYEQPKLYSLQVNQQKLTIFYHFSAIDLTISPPTPPPRC